jgi:hypothetical protein
MATLLKRLTRPQDHARLPKISGTVALDYLRDFRVQNEQVSSTHYRGTVTFRFVQSSVRSLLQQNNISFTDRQSGPFVVISTMDSGAAVPLLWEENNLWRTVWAETAIGDTLVPVVVPIGDLQDLSTITPDMSHQNMVAFDRLMQRYDATAVLWAEAKMIPSANGAPAVMVNYEVLGGSSHGLRGQLQVTGNDGDGLAAVYSTAVQQTLAALEQKFKSATVIEADENAEIARVTVVANVHSLQDWIQIERDVRRIPFVQDVMITAMTRTRLQFDVVHKGGQGAFEKAITAAGWHIQAAGTYYVLGRPK